MLISAGLSGAFAAILGPAFAAVLGAVALFGCTLWYPPLGLGLLVGFRSSLDRFTDVSILPGPVAINPASLLGVFLILMCLGLILVRVPERNRFVWGGTLTRLWVVWLLLSGFAVLTGALQHGGAGFAIGLRELIRLTSLLAVYLLVINLVPHGKGRLVIGCIAVGFLVPAAVGGYQLISGNTEHDVYGVGRLDGTFVHPNPFGAYLACVTVFFLTFLVDLRGRARARLAVGTLAVISATLLIFTFSRSALGIFLVSLVWWSMLGSRKRALLVLGALAIAAAIAFPAIAWRFQDLLEVGSTATPEGNSLAWRLMNYQRLAQSFLQSPIVGQGLGSISLVNPTTILTEEGFRSGFSAHNEFVRVLVEQGVIGLVGWIWFGVGFLKLLRRLAARQMAGWRGGHAGIGAGLFAFFGSAFILSAIGTSFLQHTAVFYLLFAVTGVLYVGQARDSETPRGAAGFQPSEVS